MKKGKLSSKINYIIGTILIIFVLFFAKDYYLPIQHSDLNDTIFQFIVFICGTAIILNEIFRKNEVVE